jgi:fucose permease
MERRLLFDFVRPSRSKNMLDMGERESRTQLAVMGIIFLLWGFADGIINIFFVRFQRASSSAVDAAFGMHAAYWGAYCFGPLLISRPILIGWGLKICLLTGLWIFWLGMLLFWPGTVLVSVPALLVASFVSGLGLSVLSTTAHLFIVLCGPPNRGEIRLSLARGVYAASGVAALILSQQVLFQHVADVSGLIEIQWIFLVLALVPMVLVAIYSFLQLPDASDEELKELTHWYQRDNCGSVCGVRVVWVTLVLGTLSQCCNQGGQEAFRTNFLYFVAFNEPK